MEPEGLLVVVEDQCRVVGTGGAVKGPDGAEALRSPEEQDRLVLLRAHSAVQAWSTQVVLHTLVRMMHMLAAPLSRRVRMYLHKLGVARTRETASMQRVQWCTPS